MHRPQHTLWELPGAPLPPPCSRVLRRSRLGRFPSCQAGTASPPQPPAKPRVVSVLPPDEPPEVFLIVEEAQPDLHASGIIESWGQCQIQRPRDPLCPVQAVLPAPGTVCGTNAYLSNERMNERKGGFKPLPFSRSPFVFNRGTF